MQMYSGFSLSYYCRLFGKSRQAFYMQKNGVTNNGLQDALALKLVAEIRQKLPRCGTDKLHYMLRESFAEHRIKLGRDGLYELLGQHGLLIRHRNRRPCTTNSRHHFKKYPNLIKEMVLKQPGMLWVSDITYIRVAASFSYLSIITDAYSHKIVGHKLHQTLHSQGAIDAFEMAVKDEKRSRCLIHHSDRGIQYCCNDYVNRINSYGIRLSMTEKGDPYENAIAERVNGILKHEHGLKQSFASHQQAQEAVEDAVNNYNQLRIHDSCGRLTPLMAHERNGLLKKYWKPKTYSRKESSHRLHPDLPTT